MILGLAAIATFIVAWMLTRALVPTPLWWLPGAGLLAGGVIELGHLWRFAAQAFDTTADARDEDAAMVLIAVCAIAHGMACLIAAWVAHGRARRREGTDAELPAARARHRSTSANGRT
jgi:hypothetical protein